MFPWCVTSAQKPEMFASYLVICLWTLGTWFETCPKGLKTALPPAQISSYPTWLAVLKQHVTLSSQARPMTRYLPNRKEEFDLRAHVESSGHSVDTCPFVILTEKMCKGHLVKMGGKIKSWKKRWFVFDRLKRNFSYYVGEDTLIFHLWSEWCVWVVLQFIPVIRKAESSPLQSLYGELTVSESILSDVPLKYTLRQVKFNLCKH